MRAVAVSLAAALVLALGSAQAQATPPEDRTGSASTASNTAPTASSAAARFDAGAFVDAYHAAAARDTAGGWTLAARAALAHVLYDPPEGDVDAWVQRARDAATRALELAPDDPAALVTAAQVRGELALRSGPLANLDAAGEIHGYLEHALEVAPEDPDALVAMGMWNLELVARGVGWLYGARREGALEQVARGVSLAPDDIPLLVQYARGLHLTGDDAEARAQIERLLALPARTAEDRGEQRRAQALLEAWGGGGS